MCMLVKVCRVVVVLLAATVGSAHAIGPSFSGDHDNTMPEVWALGSVIPATGTIPPDIGSLISTWGELSDRCQGSTDPTACDERDKVVAQLGSKGWCYGTAGQVEAEKRWQRCLTPSTAAGVQWYVYDADRSNCDSAATWAKTSGDPSVASPGAFISAHQFDAWYKSMHVDRDPGGRVAAVEIRVVSQGKELAINYFSDHSVCQGYAKYLLDNGAAAKPGELR
jgi:hypothetical protein